jgi:predicted RNase H-like HicB family nuclease
MKQHYFGIVRKDPRSDYGIDFPDFPGCITAGENLDELLRNAQEALQGHIDCMVETGEPIPAPSAVTNDDADVVCIVSVTAEVPEPRALRINVTFSAPVLAQVDRYAKTHRISRSRLLADASLEYLRRHGNSRV